MLMSIGEDLRQLTSDYIHHPSDQAKPPCVMYSFSDQDVWEKFVETRTTLDFLAKKKK